MLKKGELNTNQIVSTILTNTGFEDFMKKNSIEVVKVPVGDKNVYYKLRELEAPFGGEPSGHLIFANLCKTGDGILAALRFVSIIINRGIKASDVTKMFDLTPSKEVNINLNGKIPNLAKAEEVANKIRSKISGVSNIIVRKSGTEDKLRIVVNANLDEQTLQKYVNELVNATQNLSDDALIFDKINDILKQGKDGKIPFPKTFALLKQNGVLSYEVKFINSYSATYYTNYGLFYETPPNEYKSLQLSGKFTKEAIKNSIINHIQNKTHFVDFLADIAKCDCSHYVVLMDKNLVRYCSSDGKDYYEEPVPE